MCSATSIKRSETSRAQTRGSRYVGSGASPEAIDHVAAGGSFKSLASGEPYEGGEAPESGRIVDPRTHDGPAGKSFSRVLSDIAAHRTQGMRRVHYGDSKALAESTDSIGGFLLTPELANSVAMLIRNRVAVTQLPVTRVTPKSKRYDLIGLASGAEANWLTENAAIPSSTPTFEVKASMVPRPLGSLVAISNRLLADAVAGNPFTAGSADDVIKNDVADLLAVTMDAGLLLGDSAGPAPKGILRTTGTTPVADGIIGADGSTPSYETLVAIVSALREQNMPFVNPGWIMSGRTLQTLQTIVDSLGRPLLSGAGLLTIDPNGGNGTLLGFPYRVTNAMPNDQTHGAADNASTIIFSSDWSELFVGDWQLFSLDSSTEASYSPDGGMSWVSAYQSMQTLFRATIWTDLAIRRPKAFVLAGGILP